MTLLVATSGISLDPWRDALKQLSETIEVRIWPEAGDVRDIHYVLTWKAPAEALSNLPNLKAIFSLGAGVDHLLSGQPLPPVPIVRFVDPDLTMRMREYVVQHVLMHHRRHLDYADLQRQRLWRELPQPPARNVRVGIMGLGVLGQDAAEKLQALGFNVAGWSRSPKFLPGITCFAGEEGLSAFLARTDILVCLLPLTAETRGILNAELFAKLAKDGSLPGPVLINAGRGGLQNEADILAALDKGDLNAASLDVFVEEPLPGGSPLWSHPRIIITPHIASVSDPHAVVNYVARQIERFERGEPLENIVDRARGY